MNKLRLVRLFLQIFVPLMTPAISIRLSPVRLFEHSRDCWNTVRVIVFSYPSIRFARRHCCILDIKSSQGSGFLTLADCLFLSESLPRSSIFLPKSFGTVEKWQSILPFLLLYSFPSPFPLILLLFLLLLHRNVSTRCLFRYVLFYQHLWCSFYRIF